MHDDEDVLLTRPAPPDFAEAPFPTRDAAQDLLDLTEEVPGSFVAASGPANYSGGIFGGRLLAQSLLAAMRTVERLPATSLHAYFLGAGSLGQPVRYTVTPLRDTRRFAWRQVMVTQGGAPFFTLTCQFHEPEEGFSHQAAPMPDVPPPEQVAPLQTFVRDNAAALQDAAKSHYGGQLPVVMRPIAPERYLIDTPDEPRRDFWFRLPGAGEFADQRLQQCLLAYCSDYWLGGTGAISHAFPTTSGELRIASLDHALWFHRPVNCEDWLLHQTESPSAGQGLGLNCGRIFNRAGQLVASCAQESLLRPMR